MNIEQQIENFARQMREMGAKIRWMREHRKQLEALPDFNWIGPYLDFDRLSHADVIKVVKAFGGKWSKDTNVHSDPVKPSVDYKRKDKVDGVQVRCWGGAPPPTCRLVEVEEEIPAQVIPARKVKKLKMICTGQEPVAVALARANSPQPQT